MVTRYKTALYSLTIAFSLGLLSPIHAQKKDFTLEDAVLKRWTELGPSRISQFQWIPDEAAYSHIKTSEDGKQVLEKVLIEADAMQDLISLDELNASLPESEQMPRFPRITWTSSKDIWFKAKTLYYTVNVQSKQAKKSFPIPEGASHMAFNHDNSRVAFVMDNNLYLMTSDGTRSQVTSNGGNGIVYGQSVHRDEFGIHSGIFWSPDGSKVAFYKMDESMVTDYPLVDINSTPAKLDAFKYPMAGATSHQVTVGVFDIKAAHTTYMKTEGPSDQYLTGVTWAPNNKMLYIGVLNRDQNHLKLNRYTVNNGFREMTLFEEKDDKYVEPEHGPWFIPGDDEKFIWLSEKDGYEHMYLYNTQGKFLRQLTSGLWEVERIIGFDDTKNYLYVEGTGEVLKQNTLDDTRNATQRYTYLVDYEMGGKQMLNDEIGTHRASLSPNGKYVMEHFSSVDTPGNYVTYRSNGKQINVIHSAVDPMADYNWSAPELMSMPSGHGPMLYGRIIKPSDFDPGKKYPVLLYVYGGPHAQLVRNMWLGAAPLWMYWFAEQGYIVATIDNHGSANRGIEFEQEIFRHVGDIEMTDQMDFVNHLKNQPYVDGNRIGVHGWSYGGFMTANLLTTFPGTFKAGVAGGPVCDWRFYEVMYTERYMDTPEANPEGYETSSIVNKASQLTDPLLMIHGTADNVVVWQHSQAYLKACIDNGVQLDYFVYPGHPHNVRGKDRVHLMQKVYDYISLHLNK